MIVHPLPVPPAAVRREVAVTFDDLPVVSVTRWDMANHRASTMRILEAVAAHGVPAVGFMIEDYVVEEGVAAPARLDLLRQWLDAGPELTNPISDHLDLHATSIEAHEENLFHGEAAAACGCHHGDFNDSSAHILGLNWFPMTPRTFRINTQLMDVNDSPAGGLSADYAAGQDGTTFSIGSDFIFCRRAG